MRDAQIPAYDYFPKVYKPELIEFWPTDKPRFIPKDKLSSGLWLKLPARASAKLEGEKPGFIETVVAVEEISSSSTVQGYLLQISGAITL